MACGVKITSISLRPTEFSSTTNANHPKSTAFPRRKFPVPVASATTSPESSTATPNGPPQIELEFIAPKPGGDGEYPVERATATSGEKLLRNIMLDNKIELYATYGKVMNCGGGGSCGTCIVEKLEDALERKTIFPKSRDLFSSLSCELEIVDGKDLLNERTATELKYLKKKPESWRLACQTIVGNKENSGKVAVQRLPQWKK